MHSTTDSERGKLLEQYVLARVTMLDGIDLNHFDFDRHNTLYYFIINEHSHIYLRYGGRASRDAEKYLDLDSLDLALQKGIELHKDSPDAGNKQKRLFALSPNKITSMNAEVMGKGRCAECHLAEDYLAKEKIAADLFEPLKDLYQYPDIEELGIELDVPKGLVIDSVGGASAEAGLQKGDLITHFEGVPVYTFGDLQYAYDQIERSSTEVTIQVARKGKTESCTLTLTSEWWKSSLYFRHWSVEPMLNFNSEELTDEEKQQLGLSKASFAQKVLSTDINAMLFNLHGLKKNDIVYSVNGKETDSFAGDLIAHFNLYYQAGDSVTLGVIREGKKQEMPLKLASKRFRKVTEKEMFTLTNLVWSEPREVLHNSQPILNVRGTTANGFLLIELTHSNGWTVNLGRDFTFEPAFKPSLTLTSSDASHYRHKTYFAAKLPAKVEAQVPVKIQGLTSNGTISHQFTLDLTVPSDTHEVENAAIQQVLSTLSPVSE